MDNAIRKHPPLAALSLGAGLALLIVLWLGPLPALSRTAFSAHMLLHLGVVSVAGPLIGLGLVGLGWGRKLFPAGVVSALFALAVDVIAVWGWHVPALHEASARNSLVFVAQQASFLLAGVLVWATSFRQDARSSLGLGIVAMFATFAHMAMLGILLGMSPALIYAPDLCIGA